MEKKVVVIESIDETAHLFAASNHHCRNHTSELAKGYHGSSNNTLRAEIAQVTLVVSQFRSRGSNRSYFTTIL